MEYGADANEAMTDPVYDDADEQDTLADFPRDSKPWLDLIQDGEKAFRFYHEKCDSIDKLLSNLEHLAGNRVDREFQMFWANMEVVKPSIYSRPPSPVVVPRFKDMRELPRVASEMLERTMQTSYDKDDIHDTLIMVRDDMATNARGVAWVRYEAEENEDGSLNESVRWDHLDRKDFLHEPCRKWKENGWVARRSYLSMEDNRERFGDIALSCEYKEYKPEDGGAYDGEKKAQVWELWHKKKQVVIWVSPGVGEVLDVQPPFLKLEGFFPCPKPAYSTVQRGTLIPVPDMLYYKDQLEEVNELTARISALAESLRMKGFYAAGEETLSGAIEKALKSRDNSAVLVPVPAHLMAGQTMKDAILWIPVDMVAKTIVELIALRKQVIEDIYQITGISDIMRGDTNASETLGAQQLKSQYGSIRIKERQSELVRIARDLTRIGAEVVAENFQPQTLQSMSQMDLPTRAMVQQQQQQMMQQYQQQTMMAQQQGQQVPPPQMPKAPVTFEDVIELIRSQNVRPFVLDIETDSTIQPDENAEKQRANEFVTAVGGFIGQAVPLLMQLPQAAPLATETLKFVASKFRAGRQLEGAIEQFAEQVKQVSTQPRPDPEAEKRKHDMAMADRKQAGEDAKTKAEIQSKGIDAQLKQMDLQLKQMDLQIKGYEAQGKVQELNAREIESQKEDAGEPQEDPLDREDKMLKVEHSRVDLEGKKRALNNEGRKTEADAVDSEERAKHSIAINEASQRVMQAIDKLDERQDRSEQLIANLAKAITAPKRGKRNADGSLSIETVMS